jgi:hypothetical protein
MLPPVIVKQFNQDGFTLIEKIILAAAFRLREIIEYAS